MEEIKTVTVKDLITVLKVLPPNAKVYLSSDEEGNSYSSIHAEEGVLNSFSYENKDNAVIIYPWNEALDYNDICPIQGKLYDEEFNRERGDK